MSHATFADTVPRVFAAASVKLDASPVKLDASPHASAADASIQLFFALQQAMAMEMAHKSPAAEVAELEAAVSAIQDAQARDEIATLATAAEMATVAPPAPAEDGTDPLLAIARSATVSSASMDALPLASDDPAAAVAVTAPQGAVQPQDACLSAQVAFYTSLAVKHVLPAVARALVQGPQRANRTRGMDLFVRVFRGVSKHRGLDLKRAKAAVNALKVLGASRVAAVEAKHHYDEVKWRARLVSEGEDEQLGGSVQGGEAIPTVTVRSSLLGAHPALPREHMVTADWAYPRDRDAAFHDNKVVLYFHGGAYVFESKQTYRHWVGPLSRRLGRRVFNVEYRLAPDSPYPAALHDAAAAYLYLIEIEKIAPENIVVMGDSAGGNLSMTMLLFLRDHGYPLPGGGVLISPWADLLHNLPSYDQNAPFDYINPFDANVNLNPVAMYCGTHEYAGMVASEPYLSPVLACDRRPGVAPGAPSAAVAPLPPLYVITGTDEILLDENVLLAATLARPGMARVLVHDCFEHQVHVFPQVAPTSRDTGRFWLRMYDFLDFVDARAATAANQSHSNAASETHKVEVAVWRDGDLLAHDASVWAGRWDAIAKIKGLDWTPELLASAKGAKETMPPQSVLPDPQPLLEHQKAGL